MNKIELCLLIIMPSLKQTTKLKQQQMKATVHFWHICHIHLYHILIQNPHSHKSAVLPHCFLTSFHFAFLILKNSLNFDIISVIPTNIINPHSSRTNPHCLKTFEVHDHVGSLPVQM